MALTFSIVIDLSRMTLTGSFGGIESDVSVANRSLSVENFAARWYTLTHTMLDLYGGFFANLVILIPSLFWLFSCRILSTSSIFLFAFLSLGILPLFYGDMTAQ